MGPKVEAACRFVEAGGTRAVITSWPRIVDAVGRRRPAPSSYPTVQSEPRHDRRVSRCPSRSRSARSRSCTCPTPAGSPSSSTTACIEADRVIAVIGKTEGNGGVNDYTRIIADRAFREVLVAKGTRDARGGQAGPDRLVRRHRRRASARTRRSSPPSPGRPGRADRRAAAHRRLRDERAAAARGHRPDRRWSRRSPTRCKVAMERAGITDPPTCTTCRPRPRC